MKQSTIPWTMSTGEVLRFKFNFGISPLIGEASGEENLNERESCSVLLLCMFSLYSLRVGRFYKNGISKQARASFLDSRISGIKKGFGMMKVKQGSWKWQRRKKGFKGCCCLLGRDVMDFLLEWDCIKASPTRMGEWEEEKETSETLIKNRCWSSTDECSREKH